MRFRCVIGILFFLTSKNSEAATNSACSTSPGNWTWNDQSQILQTCDPVITEVNDEDFTISSAVSSTTSAFNLRDKPGVKFLPTNLFRTFPDLVAYQLFNSSVASVFKNHLQGLSKLRYLNLHSNKIESVANDAFIDLVSLENLNLKKNKIRSLGENLFQNNLKLIKVWLDENEIKYLNSHMFDHLAKLSYVDLELNVCINKFYRTANFNAMREELRKSCSCACGVPKNTLGLIVRGQNFLHGSFPWIVALMYTKSKPHKFFCGGTLISETFVISAAHCILEKRSKKQIKSRDILAIFGAHDLSNPYEAGSIMQSPTKVIIHDEWNHMTHNYDADISLLKFVSIKFSPTIQPICLWNSETEPAVTENIVTGWGKSEDATKAHENLPKMIAAPIQRNEECFFDDKDLLDLSSKRTFCAGLRNGSGVCHGDSGSGLSFKVNGVHHLKGIVSSSLNTDQGCDVSRNAIYTDVLQFKDWIEMKTGARKNVSCTFYSVDSGNLGRKVTSCYPNQIVDTEAYVLESSVYTNVEQFYLNKNRAVKFLPRHIGEKFPKLKEVWVWSCSLTILRNHYFKNMQNLEYLVLIDNKITTIEPDAFRDLVSLDRLWLRENMIQTLDEKLFIPMVNLYLVDLRFMNIRSISPITFEIPGEKLQLVDLRSSGCIDKVYSTPKFGRNNLGQLKADLRAKCAK